MTDMEGWKQVAWDNGQQALADNQQYQELAQRVTELRKQRDKIKSTGPRAAERAAIVEQLNASMRLQNRLRYDIMQPYLDPGINVGRLREATGLLEEVKQTLAGIAVHRPYQGQQRERERFYRENQQWDDVDTFEIWPDGKWFNRGGVWVDWRLLDGRRREIANSELLVPRPSKQAKLAKFARHLQADGFVVQWLESESEYHYGVLLYVTR